MQCCQFDVAWHIVAANHVKNDIDAFAASGFAQYFDKILLTIIDRQVRTEFFTSRALIFRACSSENGCTTRLCQLDRGGSDAARAAVYKKALAGFQGAAIENIGPNSKESLGQSGSLYGAQASGNRQALTLRHGNILRVTAPIGQGADLLTDLELRSAVTDCGGSDAA